MTYNMDIKKVFKLRFKLQQEFLVLNIPVNKIKPLVSVSVATYQHHHYIKNCLEGILMQKTNFEYEIIIGEDGSIDGTKEICIDYAKKYPEKIRLFLRNRKLSQLYDSDGNFICRFNSGWNILSARGKYIAICEGDDYWTDPLKLQKQVDFLDSNPDYGLVYSDINMIDAENNEIKTSLSYEKVKSNYKSGYIFWDLIKSNFINTLTVCARKELYTDYFNKKSYEVYAYDLRYWLYFSLRSKVKYFDEKMANYRIHDAGISRNRDFFKKRTPLVKQSAIVDYFSLTPKLESTNYIILSDILYKIVFNLNLNKKEKEPIIYFLRNHPQYYMLIVVSFFRRKFFKKNNRN